MNHALIDRLSRVINSAEMKTQVFDFMEEHDIPVDDMGLLDVIPGKNRNDYVLTISFADGRVRGFLFTLAELH